MSIDLSLPNGPSRSTPTRYANTTFRSQLEARWALFFDLLGISWKYEPQGFAIEVRKLSIIGDGSYVRGSFAYLPDFRIGGEVDYWWFEVKGRPPTKSELRKCEMLARGTLRAAVLVSGGFVNPRAFLHTYSLARPTGIVWRWLTCSGLTTLEADRITRAYRQASSATFERAKRRPRRRKGLLRRVVVELDA